MIKIAEGSKTSAQKQAHDNRRLIKLANRILKLLDQWNLI